MLGEKDQVVFYNHTVRSDYLDSSIWPSQSISPLIRWSTGSSASEGVDIYKSFPIDCSVWGSLCSPVQSNSTNHLDLIMIFYGGSPLLCCVTRIYSPPLDINLIRGATEPHRHVNSQYGNCWGSVGHQDWARPGLCWYILWQIACN